MLDARRLAVSVLLLLAALLASPAPLLAHTHLVSSSPRAGDTATSPVRTLRLEFSETPELQFTAVTILNARGDTMAVGLPKPADAPRAIIVDLAHPLPNGEYHVLWRSAGADGHPINGDYRFHVAVQQSAIKAEDSARATPEVAPLPLPVTTFQPHDTYGEARDAVTYAYTVIRWLELGAIIVLIGSAVFRHFVLFGMPTKDDDGALAKLRFDGSRLTASFASRAALVFLITMPLRVWAQWNSVHPGDAMKMKALKAVMIHSRWGQVWLAQLVIGLVTYVLYRHVKKNPRDRNWWGAAGCSVAVLTVTPGLAGHAATTNYAPLTAVFDAVHLAGAGGWLGGLMLLLVAGIPAVRKRTDKHTALARLVSAFNPVALISAGALGVTGLISTWAQIGPVSSLWHTTYGRVLLLKLLGVAVVLAVGAYNWKRLTPSLESEGTTELQRSVRMELFVAALVLLATAALVALPTGRDLAR